jgi:hypothetical protein
MKVPSQANRDKELKNYRLGLARGIADILLFPVQLEFFVIQLPFQTPDR